MIYYSKIFSTVGLNTKWLSFNIIATNLTHSLPIQSKFKKKHIKNMTLCYKNMASLNIRISEAMRNVKKDYELTDRHVLTLMTHTGNSCGQKL